MIPPQDRASRDDEQAARFVGTSQPGNNTPLVIVSERGRHSEASRRLVRAQAARASAAQSRETRARNREDRTLRESAQSPTEQQPTLFPPPAPSLQQQQQQSSSPTPRRDAQWRPLVDWVKNVLKPAATFIAVGAAAVGRQRFGGSASNLADTADVHNDGAVALQEIHVPDDFANRQLPITLPRGFVTLGQRTRAQGPRLTDAFLVVVSRTACFDFGSPGVEDRLHALLYDIVMTSSAAGLYVQAQPEHPIEGHLRIACTCLTIFQGQRADGAEFAQDQKYSIGLRAAWGEAVGLDRNALREPNAAEAALWIIFIISVTTGENGDFFHPVLGNVLQDLRLHYWEQVRSVLLEFIYPGSFLDEPCRNFYTQMRDSPQTRDEEPLGMLPPD